MSRISSQLAILCGCGGIFFMVMALFGGSWLHCQEKTIIEKNNVVNVAFRIGLWKVCPVNPSNNATETYQFNQTRCAVIGYNFWNLGNFYQWKIWQNLQFTPQFVYKMRICVPFGCAGLVFLIIGTICTIMGHCRLDNSMLFACGLFILAGILIGSGLLVFASVLSDTYYEGLSGDNVSTIHYNYGWAFFHAAGALAMAKLAVIFSVTSHMYKFGTVEDMVRAMVPGADRRLRQHVSSERLLRAPELVPPPAPYRDVEPQRPDVCEAELLTPMSSHYQQQQQRQQKQQQQQQQQPQQQQQQQSQQKQNQLVEDQEELQSQQQAQQQQQRSQARFKTLSGREPRYAAPPRPPAQFYSLPRKPHDSGKQGSLCAKSAV